MAGAGVAIKPTPLDCWKSTSARVAGQYADSAGRGNFYWLANRRQMPAIGIDFENDRVVAELIRANYPIASGVQNKIARIFALRRYMSDERQFPGGLVDGKNRDGVIAAIGGVEVFSARMDGDLRRVVVSGKSLRQRGYGLSFGQSSRVRIPIISNDRASHFVDEINPFAIGMKSHVPGSGTGFNCYKRLIAGR